MTDYLIPLAIQLTRIIVPMVMAIGIVGNSLNIAVLTRPVLYKHACSRYFLALGCNNLIFTSIMLVYRLLADGYQYDLAKVSLLACKLVTYIYQSSALLSPYFIILASIDRYCASSTNAHLRKFSNIKITPWAILLVIILILLFYMNTAILIDLGSTDAFGCRIRADSIYEQIYPFAQVVLYAIIAPGLMILFGMMTISNTKRIRVMPAAISRYRRTENQLITMLLLQVGTHIVLAVPTCVTYLISVSSSTISSTSVFYFARQMSQIFLYLTFVTPFVLYLISARTYRKELLLMIYRVFRLPGANQIYPTTNSIANTIIAMNTTGHGFSKKKRCAVSSQPDL